MKARTSLREIARIAKMGVQIHYGKELGENLQLEDLIAEYDAVFLGLGLGPDSRLKIPGADHARAQGAVAWISQLKTLPASEMSWVKELKTAVVIGGGNTALDACRELKQLGIPHVIVSYRRGEADMSGYLHEYKQARQEGVEFRLNSTPLEIQAEGPESVRVILQEGDTQVAVSTNLVLFATGQAKQDRWLSHSKHPKVFLGGDLSYGGKEVVHAVASGKKTALEIHERLTHG